MDVIGCTNGINALQFFLSFLIFDSVMLHYDDKYIQFIINYARVFQLKMNLSNKSEKETTHLILTVSSIRIIDMNRTIEYIFSDLI